MEVIKDDYISKLEVVRILQKAYAEGRIKAKDGCVSVLDDINALPAADVQSVDRWISVKDRLPELQRLERCKKCSKSTEADNFQGETELYCPLHGYPCDMIIQCVYIPDNKRYE